MNKERLPVRIAKQPEPPIREIVPVKQPWGHFKYFYREREYPVTDEGYRAMQAEMDACREKKNIFRIEKENIFRIRK